MTKKQLRAQLQDLRIELAYLKRQFEQHSHLILGVIEVSRTLLQCLQRLDSPQGTEPPDDLDDDVQPQGVSDDQGPNSPSTQSFAAAVPE